MITMLYPPSGSWLRRLRWHSVRGWEGRGIWFRWERGRLRALCSTARVAGVASRSENLGVGCARWFRRRGRGMTCGTPATASTRDARANRWDCRRDPHDSVSRVDGGSEVLGCVEGEHSVWPEWHVVGPTTHFSLLLLYFSFPFLSLLVFKIHFKFRFKFKSCARLSSNYIVK
jgi:hypothetical protein